MSIDRGRAPGGHRWSRMGRPCRFCGWPAWAVAAWDGRGCGDNPGGAPQVTIGDDGDDTLHRFSSPPLPTSSLLFSSRGKGDKRAIYRHHRHLPSPAAQQGTGARGSRAAASAERECCTGLLRSAEPSPGPGTGCPLLRGVQEVEWRRVLAVSLLPVVLGGPPAPERWFGRLRRGPCETGPR
jgi:hypothetical protein